MKKFAKIMILLVAVAALGFSTMFAASAETTTTAPDSVKTGSAKLMDSYLGTITISYKTLSDGSIYYCTQFAKDVPASGVTMTKVGPMDAGMTYLIKNGYPSKSLTGDNKKDFFITQLAVWWYQDIQTGSNSSVLAGLKAGNYDNTDLGKKIIALKDGAVKANKEGYKSSSLKLNSSKTEFAYDETKKEYTSTLMDVTATNLSGKYTVSLVGAPEGTYVVNEKGDKQVKFEKNEKFKVVVPASGDAESIDFSVKVSGISSVSKAYKYKPSDSSVQNIVLGKLYKEKKDMTSTSKFNIKAEKVEVPEETTVEQPTEEETTVEQPTEEETKEETTVEQPTEEETKEETTEEVVTEEQVVVVTEVITEQQEFEDVVEEEVNVPDTASAASVITYVLGGVIAVLGTGLVVKNVKKA